MQSAGLSARSSSAAATADSILLPEAQLVTPLLGALLLLSPAAAGAGGACVRAQVAVRQRGG